MKKTARGRKIRWNTIATQALHLSCQSLETAQSGHQMSLGTNKVLCTLYKTVSVGPKRKTKERHVKSVRGLDLEMYEIEHRRGTAADSISKTIRPLKRQRHPVSLDLSTWFPHKIEGPHPSWWLICGRMSAASASPGSVMNPTFTLDHYRL